MKVFLRSTLFMLLSTVLIGCDAHAVILSPQPSSTPIVTLVVATAEAIHITDTPTLPPKYLPEEEFRGFFEFSFEVSSFVPCGSSEPTGYGQGYWIDYDWQSEFFTRYSKLASIPNAEPAQGGAPGQVVYVEFIGMQVNPEYGTLMQGGEYGHMGQYEGEIIVIELIEMSLQKEQQCLSQ